MIYILFFELLLYDNSNNQEVTLVLKYI